MRRLGTSLVACLALVSVGAPVALAGDDREDVQKSGRCTGATTWKLDVGEEDREIEVEFEVDQNRNGVRWNVALRQNGKLVFRGVRATRPPSGSFELRRVLADRARTDRIVAVATSPTGERCRGAIVF